MPKVVEKKMKKVLFGGKFDLLHAAHILAIWKARRYGDYLVVSVVSDERLAAKAAKKYGRERRYEGSIIPENERRFMVSAIKGVDEVVTWPGSEYPVIHLLDKVKPDVLVISGDNPVDVEKACQERGIELIQLERIVVPSGLDTSGIINKILDTRKW